MADKDVELVLTNPLSWRGFLWGQLCDVNSIFYYAKLVVLLSIGQPDQEHRDCLSKNRAQTNLLGGTGIFAGIYPGYSLVDSATHLVARPDLSFSPDHRCASTRRNPCHSAYRTGAECTRLSNDYPYDCW